MRLWQGRLQGFRTDTEITPAMPAPSCVSRDLLPALREPNPTCQGLLAPSKGRDNGDFPPHFWGKAGALVSSQHSKVRSFSLKQLLPQP